MQSNEQAFFSLNISSGISFYFKDIISIDTTMVNCTHVQINHSQDWFNFSMNTSQIGGQSIWLGTRQWRTLHESETDQWTSQQGRIRSRSFQTSE